MPAGLDTGPVQVVDEIPVEIDVVEIALGDGLVDDVRGGVSGKAHVPAAAFPLKFPRDLQTATWFQ